MDGGDAAYLWAPVTVEEVGNILERSGYYRLSEIEPSQLDLAIPASAVVDDPWLLESGAGAGDAGITQSSLLPVRAPTGSYEDKTLEHVSEHVRPRTTAPLQLTAAWESTPNQVENHNNRIGLQNAIYNGVGQLVWAIPDSVPTAGGDSVPKADVVAYFNAHHHVKIKAGSKVLTAGFDNFFTLSNNTNYYINMTEAAQTGGAFSDGASVTIELASNIPSRSELADEAYQANTPNIGSGPANKTWKTDGSGVAGWRD